jgi:hypothetical protein
VRGAEGDDPRPEVTLTCRATIARARTFAIAGTFALVVGALITDDGITWGDEGVLALGSATGIALGVAGTTGMIRRRVETARPVAPGAVRVPAPRRSRALREATPIVLLVAVAALLSAWNGGGFVAGVLWIAWAAGAGVQAHTVRVAERRRGGRLAVITTRRPWRVRLRHPFPAAMYVLLRPRVDVTVGDEALTPDAADDRGPDAGGAGTSPEAVAPPGPAPPAR